MSLVASVSAGFARVVEAVNTLHADLVDLRNHTPGANPTVVKCAIVGELTADVESPRWYPDRGIELAEVYFSLGTVADSDVVIDVLKNGVSVFAGAKPTCAAGQHRSSTADTIAALSPTDYLTVSVVSAGGADATVCMTYF